MFAYLLEGQVCRLVTCWVVNSKERHFENQQLLWWPSHLCSLHPSRPQCCLNENGFISQLNSHQHAVAQLILKPQDQETPTEGGIPFHKLKEWGTESLWWLSSWSLSIFVISLSGRNTIPAAPGGPTCSTANRAPTSWVERAQVSRC